MFSRMVLLPRAISGAVPTIAVLPIVSSYNGLLTSRARGFSSNGGSSSSSSSSKPSNLPPPSDRRGNNNGPSSNVSSPSSSSSNKPRPSSPCTAPGRGGVIETADSGDVQGATTTPTAPPMRLKRTWGGIPFVPGTDHMHPADVATSTFFALHRPLSISSPVPTPMESLDSIFVSADPAAAAAGPAGRRPAPARKPSLVMTVSIRTSVSHTNNGSSATTATSATSPQSSTFRIPIEESPWKLGHPFVAPPPPTAFTDAEYLDLQEGGEGGSGVGVGDTRGGRHQMDEMVAISVKRQRKLKMKKHKYKKLMKRTRNSRRRIERQRN